MRPASEIERSHLLTIWTRPVNNVDHPEMAHICPNCLALRRGDLSDSPHAKWCAVWRNVQMLELQAESRTVRFHFEQTGHNAHVAEGLFTYDTPENAQAAVLRMQQTPGYSNVEIV